MSPMATDELGSLGELEESSPVAWFEDREGDIAVLPSLPCASKHTLAPKLSL